MTKAYCVDTSGLTTPLERLPMDIYPSIWNQVTPLITSGSIGVTFEIYEEMCLIAGPIGDLIRQNKDKLVLEIGENGWDWSSYIEISTTLQQKYESVISEFSGNRKNTIGLNDLSIIALGMTMSLPVVSMESPVGQVSPKRKRIPEVCDLEGIIHYTFNDLLRKEGISV